MELSSIFEILEHHANEITSWKTFPAEFRRVDGWPLGIEPEDLNIKEMLRQYFDFCVVNRGMQQRVAAKDNRALAAGFPRLSKRVVSEATVGEYLRLFLFMKPKTYNNQLGGLRSLVGRFLNPIDITDRFKRVWQPSNYESTLRTLSLMLYYIQRVSLDIKQQIARKNYMCISAISKHKGEF